LARPEEARALHRRVAGHARLIVFDRAGHHNLIETAPQLYSRSILEFIRAVRR
jgi:hypothetical protein